MRTWTLCAFHSLNQYPTLSEGADNVDGQVRRDKEFSSSSGRVWRKVPESDAGRVHTDTQRYKVGDVTSNGRVWRRVPAGETWSVERARTLRDTGRTNAASRIHYKFGRVVRYLLYLTVVNFFKCSLTEFHVPLLGFPE